LANACIGKARQHGALPHLFLKRFVAQKVYTACTKTSYKIVPLTNLSKYVNYDTTEMEMNVRISATNNNEYLFKKLRLP